jgi:hypothetical protein
MEWDLWDWKGGLEKNSSRRGWSFTERPYEDLDISVKICIVFRSANYMFFSYINSRCTKCTERYILVSLIYLHNLPYLQEVPSISLVT